MEIVQSNEGLRNILTVKISQSDYEEKVNRELKKVHQTVALKGFRPGKAPMPMIRKLYGESVFLSELNKLLTEALDDFKKNETRSIVGDIIPRNDKQPKIDWNEMKDFEFVFEAAFLPEPAYTADAETELTYRKIVPEAAEIDSWITEFRFRHGKEEYELPVDEEARVYVHITVNDPEQPVASSFLQKMIPDEYKSLFLDAKVGDERDVEIRKVFGNKTDLRNMLQLQTDEELEALPETLKFKITKIITHIPAELNQDFFDEVESLTVSTVNAGASETGEEKPETETGEEKPETEPAKEPAIHNEAELKAFVGEKILTKNYERYSDTTFYDEAVKILAAKLNLAISEEFLQDYILHVSEEKFGEELKNDPERMKETVKDVENEVITDYITDMLCKQNSYQPSNDDVIKEAYTIVDRTFYNYDLSYEHFNSFVKNYLESKENVMRIVKGLRQQNATKVLKDNVKLDIKEVTFNNFKTGEAMNQ